ncbi:MAG: amidohydrolase, partial [Firmicutes bacterium]|nr:amidohydrolase [Bacillota bacterium]
MRIVDEKIWQEITPWMINLRRQIHRYPELGLETPQTAGLIAQTLQELGLATWRPIANGVVATLGPSEGSAILLRADMDALPIFENTDLPYASTIEGRMHACGHDAHTAMLLGAAFYLKAHEQELMHPVTLMFQPAEEGPGGALPMIEGGVLDRPSVARAVMVHVTGDLPAGVIGLRGGPAMASPNDF